MTRTEINERLKDLERRNGKLLWENLKMRLEFEVLIDHPEGKAAKKILARYRRKRDIRDEASLATQN